MKEILLTQGKVAFVDDSDFEELSRHKWHAYKSRKTYYAARTVANETGGRSTLNMHTQLMRCELSKFPPRSVVVDHKDHNGLNNQRDNFVITNTRGNRSNLRGKSLMTSRYTGVSWCKRTRKWHSQIRINGKQTSLGRFAVEEDARQAYEDAVKGL